MMKRDEVFRILASHYSDGIVVAVYQSAFDWINIRPHPLNYLCTGAMGLASSHALGLAIGLPDEKIVVLDGDGSLLMNLGSLVTIANQAPVNLVHFVCCNSIYEVNGKFPIPGAGQLSFEGIAREAGYKASFSFRELSEFESSIERVLHTEGPVFVELQVEQGHIYPTDYVAVHSAESRLSFREAVQARISGT